MSQNKLISIKNPIINALDMCGADHTKDLPSFYNWAYEAEKQIKSKYNFIRTIKVLDIEGCVACLPLDCAYLEVALFGDYGCDCQNLFTLWCGRITNSTTTTETSSFYIVDVANSGSNATMDINTVSYTIQDNKILFNHNYDGQKVTIQYQGYKCDCEGFMEISENHVLAIKDYICLQYYLRRKRKSNDDFAMINRYDREWNRNCMDARAVDAMPTESERQEIVHGIHHNPLVGIGLSLGMRTTLGMSYTW